MLLPDNIKPENSVYYIGAMILEKLKVNKKEELLQLYGNLKDDMNVSFSLYILSLDWLYLLEVAEVNSSGEVELCF